MHKHTQAYSIYIQRPEDWHNHINTYLHHAPGYVLTPVNMQFQYVCNIWVDSVSLDKGFVQQGVGSVNGSLIMSRLLTSYMVAEGKTMQGG